MEATKSPDGVIAAFNDLKAFLLSLPTSTKDANGVWAPGTIGVENMYVVATEEQRLQIEAKRTVWDDNRAAQQVWYNQEGYGDKGYLLVFDREGSGAILGVKAPFMERRTGATNRRKA